MICFSDITGWKPFSPDPLNISYGRSFCYFRIVSLLWELIILFWEILNSYLSSWYPSMSLAQQPVTKVIGLAKGPWGKISGSYFNSPRKQEQFPSTLALMLALLGWSGMMFAPSYISALTPLCLFHCWKTQNITFSSTYCLSENTPGELPNLEMT